MSQIHNRHWIGFNGEPITGRIPPQLLVYGPDLTGRQRGEVFHIYKLFTDACRVALGDYHVRNRVLSDGSRVRCTSFMGQDTVQVWTRGKVVEEELGGFVCRPTSGVGDGSEWEHEGPARWWGKPYTAENTPLGTLYGEKEFSVLRPKWGRKLPSSRYSIKKGVEFQYGAVDWQGRDPKTDVLSWDAKTYNYVYFFSGTGNIQFFFDRWFQFGTSGTFNENFIDSTKSSNFVRRALNRGSGSNVYRNGAVFATIPGGNVDGVALTEVGQRRCLVGAQRTSEPTSTTGEFSFFVFDGSTKTTIGTFRPASNWFNTQGWYFNLEGRKARCVCYEVTRYSSPAQFRYAAYELEIVGDSVEELSAVVREIAIPASHYIYTADFRRDAELELDQGVLAIRSTSGAHYVKVVDDGGATVYEVERPFSSPSLNGAVGSPVVVSSTYADGVASFVVELEQAMSGGVRYGALLDFDARYDAACLFEFVDAPYTRYLTHSGTLSSGNYSVNVSASDRDSAVETRGITVGRKGQRYSASPPWVHIDPASYFFTATPSELEALYG